MQWPLQQACCEHAHEIHAPKLPQPRSGAPQSLHCAQLSSKAAQTPPAPMHCPFEQLAPPPHTLPQAPQLFGSEVMSMQVPVPVKKQHSCVTGFGQSLLDMHAVPLHSPLTHVVPASQQVVPQGVVPLGQTHMPLMQDWGAWQQVVPQGGVPLGQTHMPLMQDGGPRSRSYHRASRSGSRTCH
jgi:hypothetical protein